MKKFVFTVCSLLALSSASAKTTKKPNVIVILADDLGFGDVSAYGQKTVSTPNIDALAHGGVCFNNGYATSATSTPSRYGLMTGTYPWKNERARILPGDAPLIIGEDQFTLPKMFKQAGYATGAIGKWHLGMGHGEVNWNETIKPGAREVGFDYSCLIAATVDRVPTVYIENGDVVGLEKDDPIYVNYHKNFEGEPTALTNPEMVRLRWEHGHNNSVVNGIPRIGFMKGGKNARWVDETMAQYFVDKVKGFISEQSDDKPFFLYYGLHQPHVPRTPDLRFVGATTMGARGDVIVEADWCVGELISCLKEKGILDNTIIVFTSDNGPVLNDGYIDEAVERVGEHMPTGGLRGGKYSLFDAGTHVPFFLYWNGTVKPKQSKALVCQMDLLASLASLVGSNLPSDLDSQNLLPAFLGKSDKGREELVFEAHGRIALRSGDWVLIPPYKGRRVNETGNELGNLENYGLFNLKDDRMQTTDFANKYPALVEKLKTRFEQLTAK